MTNEYVVPATPEAVAPKEKQDNEKPSLAEYMNTLLEIKHCNRRTSDKTILDGIGEYEVMKKSLHQILDRLEVAEYNLLQTAKSRGLKTSYGQRVLDNVTVDEDLSEFRESSVCKDMLRRIVSTDEGTDDLLAKFICSLGDAEDLREIHNALFPDKRVAREEIDDRMTATPRTKEYKGGPLRGYGKIDISKSVVADRDIAVKARELSAKHGVKL
jgi:hypothetical protein